MSKINMVRREGGSRVLSVSKVIPVSWTAVELVLIKSTKKSIMLRINKVK